MRQILFAVAFALALAPATADERTPWKEPALGPITPTGTTIDLENLHCTVLGPRTMTCLNVGRVCVEQRARNEAHTARIFGCAIKSSPNYPCPPDTLASAEALEREFTEFGHCRTMYLGQAF